MSQLSIIKQMFEALSDEEKANYHNFVNFAKGNFADKLTILQEHTFTTETHIRCRGLRARAPVPVLRVA